MKHLAAALAIATLAACASMSGPVYDQMTDADIAARVTVKGDALDGYRIATGSAIRAAYPPLTSDTSKVYFEAVRPTDGTGGAVVRVVVQVDSTKDWPGLASLNFGDPLRRVVLERVDADADCYRGGCTRRELARGILSAADVAWILTTAPSIFDVRVKSQVGDIDRRLRVAELRAVMAAVGN